MKKYIITTILFISIFNIYAQLTYDSSLAFPYVQIHGCLQMPGGDLAKRFGNNANLGMSVTYKFQNNITLSLNGNYFFSKNVKDNVLSQLQTTNGSGQTFVIDNEGFPADLRVNERGWNANITVGKIFYVGGNNKNRGIHYQIGAGYFQHKIFLYDAQKKVAAIKGSWVKGYDRLSIGPCIYQYLGYTYLSSNKYVNFTAGIEMYYALTKNVRYYDYATASIDNKLRNDFLFGIKFGWILPIYRKADGIFFYN